MTRSTGLATYPLARTLADCDVLFMAQARMSQPDGRAPAAQ